MKSHYKGNGSTCSELKQTLDTFSSAIALPTRKRNSLFSIDQHDQSPLRAADNCSWQSNASQSTPHLSSDKQSHLGESNKIESQPIEVSSSGSKQSQRSVQSFSKFLLQESDSLIKRYNSLQYSQHRTQDSSKSTDKEIIILQAEEQVLINEPAPTQPQAASNSEQIEERFSLLNVAEEPLITKMHIQPQPRKETHQQELEQKHNQKNLQKQESSHYAEWPEVFDQSSMMDIYHNYNPLHEEEEELGLVMQAIVKAEESQKCGKVFMEQAYEHYRLNYGRMSVEAFNLKVVGDVLYLFRKHNEKRQKYEKDRLQYEQKERRNKKNRTRL